MDVVMAMTRRMVASVATRGRMIALAAISGIGIMIAILIRINLDDGGPELTDYVHLFGLTIFVPLVSMMVATATLGSLRDERTLAYFWLRPFPRWKITAAALLAALLVVVPVIISTMAIIGAVTGGSTGALGAAVAATVGIVAYSAMFTLAGLLTTRALLWGLVYLLVWEGVIAGLSRTAGRFAISTYTQATLEHITDIAVTDDPPSGLMIGFVTVGVAAAGALLTTWHLSKADVD